MGSVFIIATSPRGVIAQDLQDVACNMFENKTYQLEGER